MHYLQAVTGTAPHPGRTFFPYDNYIPWKMAKEQKQFFQKKIKMFRHWKIEKENNPYAGKEIITLQWQGQKS